MRAHAVLLAARGGRLTSPGLYALRSWMVSRHITAEVHGSAAWESLAEPLHKRKQDDPDSKLIIVGYSLGGMRACDLCNLLAQPHRAVSIDLLVTLVPPRRRLSWTVKKALNHTVKGGAWWSDYLYDAHGRDDPRIVNINHASELSITHYSIQALPSVHASIHRAVEEVIV
jgi:predicted esterase